MNDTYGHDAGDEVLKEISEILEYFMTGKGVAARRGGEEFLLVFNQVNGDICAEQGEEKWS
ncbi:MAG: diguanylate cyclase [Butyrivibrio sp.]|nr:diguanylate cyclase [Butyrivibrio sp.]